MTRVGKLNATDTWISYGLIVKSCVITEVNWLDQSNHIIIIIIIIIIVIIIIIIIIIINVS